jgi:hypothetical protein
MDEHRIGLKPIVRGVWAPIGERPIALGHHRFEWLYVTGFVEPATGRTVWNIANAVCKELFELILVDFARSVGAGADKRIVLQLDNAGWHGPENLAVPDGIRLVFQPAHSPELQPAEHLWQFVDEPLANRCFATIESLDHAVGQRCSPSPTSATPPVTAPSSTGGRASHKGCNQPEPILLHLDTGKFDHLGPLRSFVCDEASEFGARTRRHGCS